MSDPAASTAFIGPASAEAAFAAIVLACATEIDRHLAEVMETASPEGPHKTRVALRRLTTALDAFHPILRKTEARRLRDKAKDIFRRLGLVRDADVYHLSRAAAGAKPTPELLALREAVRAALRRRDALAFGPLLLRRLADGTLLRDSPVGLRRRAVPAADLISTAMDRAFDALCSHGKALKRMDDTARHEFRKDLKSLRYLNDFISETDHGPGAGLCDLQDVLGTLNDLANARARERKAHKGKSPRRGKAELAALREADLLWAGLRKSAPWWQASSV